MVEDFSNQPSSSLEGIQSGAFMIENRSHPLERPLAEGLSLRLFIPVQCVRHTGRHIWFVLPKKRWRFPSRRIESL